MRARIIQLATTGRCSEDGATWRDTVNSRLREAVGRILQRWHVPGIVQPMMYDDPVTDDHVEIGVSPLAVRLSINGRDYYFDRFTGQFDGTGQGCG